MNGNQPTLLTQITASVLDDLDQLSKQANPGMVPPGIDPALAGGMPPAAMGQPPPAAMPQPGAVPGMPQAAPAMPGQVPGQPAAAPQQSAKGKAEERLANLEAAVAEILKELKMANPEQALADTVSQQPGAQTPPPGPVMPSGPMDPMAGQAIQQMKMGRLRVLDMSEDGAAAIAAVVRNAGWGRRA